MAAFCLDECLPAQVAEALEMVEYPITHNEAHGLLEGTKDEVVIPTLAADGLVWITRDDKAKTAHRHLIEGHQLSVVWVRGFERSKVKPPQIKELHFMLAAKLDPIAEMVDSANGPRYFSVWLKGPMVPAFERVLYVDGKLKSAKKSRR